MSNHPNSIEADRTHSMRKARTDRRMICAFVASKGSEGASDEDIAEAVPSVHANSVRIRRGELDDTLRGDGYRGHGFITDTLGVTKKSKHGKNVTCWFVTEAGLRALGLDPLTHWHSGTKAVIA